MKMSKTEDDDIGFIPPGSFVGGRWQYHSRLPGLCPVLLLHSAQRRAKRWGAMCNYWGLHRARPLVYLYIIYVYTLYIYIFIDVYHWQPCRQGTKKKTTGKLLPLLLPIWSFGRGLLLLQSRSWHGRAASLHVGALKISAHARRSLSLSLSLHTSSDLMVRYQSPLHGLCLCPDRLIYRRSSTRVATENNRSPVILFPFDR